MSQKQTVISASASHWEPGKRTSDAERLYGIWADLVMSLSELWKTNFACAPAVIGWWRNSTSRTHLQNRSLYKSFTTQMRSERGKTWNYFDKAPFWWCILNYSKLHRRNCAQCLGEIGRISYSPRWWCIEKYSKCHWRHQMYPEAETGSIDETPWWPRVAKYVPVNWGNHVWCKGELLGKE